MRLNEEAKHNIPEIWKYVATLLKIYDYSIIYRSKRSLDDLSQYKFHKRQYFEMHQLVAFHAFFTAISAK